MHAESLHCDSGHDRAGGGAVHPADAHGHRKGVAFLMEARNAQVELVDARQAGRQTAPVHDDLRLLHPRISEEYLDLVSGGQRGGGSRLAGGDRAALSDAQPGGVHH